MTSAVTEKMSEASANIGSAQSGRMDAPKKGERYRCETCGMEIQVTADCHCKSGDQVQFRCCGMDMTRA